jgi:hypothetical protein
MGYHIWINCGFSTDILYEADSQIGEFHLYRDYDKSNPRIQIGIRNVAIRRLTGRQMDEPSLSCVTPLLGFNVQRPPDLASSIVFPFLRPL